MNLAGSESVIDQLPGLYVVLDPTFRIAAVSDAYLSATMTDRSKILGRSMFDVFPDNPGDPHADGVRNLRASLERVRDTLQADTMAVQKYDIRRPEAEGGAFEVRYWSPQNYPVLIDGRLTYIVHRAVDVTDYVQLQERAATQDNVNAELRTQADRTANEILVRGRELQTTNARLREAQAQLESLNAQLEKRVLERTSELRAANLALRQEMDARAHAEEQFRQAQKMEAIGLLAGGIAHDFNNLLTVILSCSTLLGEEIIDGHPLRRDVLDITESAERAAGLTRQLLTFSRRQVSSPTSVDLNDVVQQSVPLFKRLLGEKVRLESMCAPGLERTRVDRGLVEQVLMNLVVNARDAMPLGGSITIETGKLELDEHAGGYLGASPGKYVMLAVTDTGTGMNDDTRARLFLPFFTTKGVGRGTGLGLSMVHGVVKQSHGELFVRTTLGEGTTFKVCFPVEAETSSEPTLRLVEARPPVKHSAIILLVEDEEAVREVAARILRQGGYTVLTAASPAQALARFSDVKFELLLTDVVMPDMDGPTFVEKLSELRPEAFRVLFMSGYTGGTAVHQRVLESNAGFVQKPFTPRQLLASVREALATELQLAVSRGA